MSDHLAAVSLLSSERWMECLTHFEGWTDPTCEAKLRKVIEGLKLRPLDEPGDVDSPLLRSQIDEQFLRTMAAARESMSVSSPHLVKKLNTLRSSTVPQSVETDVTAQSSRHGLPLHPQVCCVIELACVLCISCALNIIDVLHRETLVKALRR